MWRFHQKMKRLSYILSGWSKIEFGDIFQNVSMFEEWVHKDEENYMSNQSYTNRCFLHKINAKYIKFLKLEDTILTQKTQLYWFKEGDNNSKYFNSVIKGRRRKLFIHKVVNENGVWVQGYYNTAHVAWKHFKGIFSGEEKHINEHTLECIPRMISQDQNTQLTVMPNMDELKEVVFSMNPNSAGGPHGMNGYLYKKCLHIIKNDVMEVLQAFFREQMIPKYFSHSCIVFLPIVNNPNKKAEFRPISLSNFTSKIISKIVSKRLSPIIPTLISTNQYRFVKRQNYLRKHCACSINHSSHQKPNVGSNVIIKLDMAKAYDRVSWSYIYLVLRKMGFDEVFIDMLWRIMANYWYSIIVNDKRYGFFIPLENSSKVINFLQPYLFLVQRCYQYLLTGFIIIWITMVCHGNERDTGEPFELCWWHHFVNIWEMQNIADSYEYIKGVWEYFRTTHQWLLKSLYATL